MNPSNLKEIIKLFSESDVDVLKLKEENFKLCLKKNSNYGSRTNNMVQEHKTSYIQSKIQEKEEVKSVIETTKNVNSLDSEFITSPMVGTFYKSPSPGAAPFANVGDIIRKGQIIGIVEAMKIMNEIEAEFDCKIISFEISDAQPVEYGSKIVCIERI